LFPHFEEILRALVETFPMIRQCRGIVDLTGNCSLLISKTPLDDCFISCGWGKGIFKVIPGSS
jgi:sarcosine oxidase, subunit beta